MKAEKFYSAVAEEVRGLAGSAYDVRLIRNRKNNGVIYTGLTMMLPGEKGSPCIRLDDYYKEYKGGGEGIRETAEAVYAQFLENRGALDGVDVAGLSDWDTVGKRVCARLVNAEMNRDSLAGMPHRKLLDLAVIYCAEVDGIAGEDGVASFLIEDRHMKAWGLKEEDFYRTACRNMRLSGEAVFESMKRILRRMMGEIPFAGEILSEEEFSEMPDAGLYVLTNRRKLFGAAELLDGNTLREIGDRLGNDYIVLPSSLHECIILPADGRVPYGDLAEMVWGINREQVSVEERLSDHVYLYEREKETLTIAA